jgi:hypothetical protein
MYVGRPTDHPELAHVHFARLFTHFPLGPDWLRVSYRSQAVCRSEKSRYGEPERFVP